MFAPRSLSRLGEGVQRFYRPNRPALTADHAGDAARKVRVDPSLLAGLDVLDLEIAPVGHHRDALQPENLFCRSAVCASRPKSTTWLVTCSSTISLYLGSPHDLLKIVR